MHVLKLSFSLPDADRPQMELHVSSNDSDCDVVIALPLHTQPMPAAGKASAPPMSADDEYVLGGYAGI